MFLLNSRLGLFTAAYILYKHSFSLSYGVILPSSLTMVLLLTLGFSPWPRVFVLGTGINIILLEAFLESWRQVFYVSYETYTS